MRAAAKARGISFGELLRQLLLVGAAAKIPSLAKKMMASHREYYPARQFMATIMVLLAAGLFFQAVGGRHDLRRSKVAHRANIHRIFREGLVTG